MPTRNDRPTLAPYFRRLLPAISLAALLVGGVLPAFAADATGSIIGSVSSKETHNALQGALISLPALNRTTFSDSAGQFLFQGVPAGPVQLAAAYRGFGDVTATVVVGGGTPTRLNLVLQSTELVTMAPFTVASVREGQALSVTEQRNSRNIKTVAALDEWGILPTQNVGELFTRLPGISFTTDEDDLINNITVRGMVSSNGQSFTRLNIDGLSATGVGGNGRNATLHSFSAAMYEQIEVIAGQTPDKRADSIGGQINLKTRSPLAMKEKRRLNYNISGRYSPGTDQRNVEIGQHPYGYSTSFDYTQVFDVHGGERNLGLVFNVAQQQVIGQFDYDVLQYPGVLDNSAAYFRDYDKRSGTNHRFITGLGARADYRVSATTTVSARFLYNAGSEPFFHYTFINSFFSTNGTIFDPATNPAGGFVAGSNSTRAEIRPTGNAQMLLTPRRWSFTSNNPTGTLVFEHDLGRLKLDHAWRLSRTHWDVNAGRQREGGQLTLRTRDPIGFILDNSHLDGRVFTQTAGPSVYDPASYASFVVTGTNPTTIPVAQTSLRFDKRSVVTDTKEWGGTVNASYSLDTSVPITLKAGFDTVNRKVDGFQPDPLRWYAPVGVVLSGLPLMPLTTFEKNQGGQRLPVFDPNAVSPTLGDPAKWYPDVNFTATQRLTSSRHMNETVDAEYVQGQIKLARLTLLGGFRWEKVKDATWTYFRARSTPIAIEPDHFKRAALDFNRQSDRGGYTKRFPSVHASYDLGANLKARASWSTSYSRPDLLQLIPGVTANDVLQTVTIGNPDLRPQLAKNLDIKLEYYAGSSGLFTITGYEKRISDYIPSGVNFGAGGDTVPNTPDNGFDGLYGGYQVISPKNIGALKIQGVEIDYKQLLSFLPGPLKGLTVRANYTWLRGDGQFYFTATQVGAIGRTTRQIPGLLPRSGNLGLQYAYGKFGASCDLNYTGEYADFNVGTLTTPTFVQLLAYRKSLTRVNAGLNYRVRPNATLYLNMSNLTETGPDRYTWVTSRPRQHTVAPMSMMCGITGRY